MSMDSRNINDISSDEAVCKLLESIDEDISTVFTRSEAMKPCPIGATYSGICCKNCSMGPCRIMGDDDTGLCGATLGTIAASILLPGPLRILTMEGTWRICWRLLQREKPKV
jgi:hydroxylamine reductase (hybrid-cluster protein)